MSVTANSESEARQSASSMVQVESVTLTEPVRRVRSSPQARLPFHRGANS